jgi:sugar phosphate isomerase/epimerase
MPQQASQAPSGALKILLCTIAFRDKLLEYALDVARKVGFDGVEIWGREPHVAEKFDENRMRATRKLLDIHGVVPYVLGSYLRFGRTRNELDVQLTDTLHVARWLRTPLIRVWASDVGSAQASPQTWKQTVAEAQDACDRAAKLNITLAVEMHAGTLADTADASRKLVEDVNRPNFGLNFQIASLRDGDTPEMRLQKVLPYVVHVHAQNYATIPLHPSEPLRRVPLSSGVANYPVLIHTLRDSGYTGHVAVEFAYAEGPDKIEALAEDLRFLRSLCS